MPRNPSAAAREAVFSQSSSKAWLILLEIDHETLEEPIRVSSDAVDTEHNGNTYISFPFEINLPVSDSEEISEVQLRIDNVDRQITETIREINSAPDVTMKLVLGDTPNVVEAGPFEFSLENVNYNEIVVEGNLRQTSFLAVSYPKNRFVPTEFNAL